MKKLLLFCTAFLFCTSSFAQMIADPTTWTYEVKKKSATEYDLVFHLRLSDGWHIWSLNPGGDGYQVVPSFTFDKNDQVTLKGKAKEKGKPVTGTYAGVDGKVTYFSKQVDYTQTVIVKGKATIKGKHEYQVCNDRLCLPPKDKDFVFNIK